MYVFFFLPNGIIIYPFDIFDEQKWLFKLKMWKFIDVTLRLKMFFEFEKFRKKETFCKTRK